MKDNVYKLNSFRLSQDELLLLKLVEKLLVDILTNDEQVDPNTHYTVKEFTDKLSKISNRVYNTIDNSLNITTVLPKLNILKISTDTDTQSLSSTTALSPLKLNRFIGKINFYGLVKYAKLTDLYNINENTKVVTNNIFNKFNANTNSPGLVKFASREDITDCILLI